MDLWFLQDYIISFHNLIACGESSLGGCDIMADNQLEYGWDFHFQNLLSSIYHTDMRLVSIFSTNSQQESECICQNVVKTSRSAVVWGCKRFGKPAPVPHYHTVSGLYSEDQVSFPHMKNASLLIIKTHT